MKFTGACQCFATNTLVWCPSIVLLPHDNVHPHSAAVIVEAMKQLKFELPQTPSLSCNRLGRYSSMQMDASVSSLMVRTEMVLKTLVYSPSNHLTRVVFQENITEFSCHESSMLRIMYLFFQIQKMSLEFIQFLQVFQSFGRLQFCKTSLKVLTTKTILVSSQHNLVMKDCDQQCQAVSACITEISRRQLAYITLTVLQTKETNKLT